MADIPQNIDFGHYMALGMVWYGAKYSHGVWERFAHAFGKSDFLQKSVFLYTIVFILCYVFCHFLLCFGQSATP